VTVALAQARKYGVAVCFADLGDWGKSELRAEYDPLVPEIRLNIRIAEALPIDQLGTFVALATGHELYHHREHIGEVAVIAERELREAAAAAFARELLERSA
jgi:hypothetical protein